MFGVTVKDFGGPCCFEKSFMNELYGMVLQCQGPSVKDWAPKYKNLFIYFNEWKKF